MPNRRVVITGLGALTPLGNTVENFWTALINGVSGAGPITRFDASKFKTRFACEVKNFDMGQYFDCKEIGPDWLRVSCTTPNRPRHRKTARSSRSRTTRLSRSMGTGLNINRFQVSPRD